MGLSSAMLALVASIPMGHSDALCVQTASLANMAHQAQLVRRRARCVQTAPGLMLVHLRAKFAHQDEAARVHKIQHRTAWAVPTAALRTALASFTHLAHPKVLAKLAAKAVTKILARASNARPALLAALAKLQEA